MIIKALGGSISYEPNKPEIGGVQIELHPQSEQDPLFRGIKTSILAISAHQDMVYQLPPECILLPDNPRCLRATRVKKKPIWGLQFHAEAIPKLIKAQFPSYQSKKSNDKIALKTLLKSIVKTREANKLVRRFAEYVQHHLLFD